MKKIIFLLLMLISVTTFGQKVLNVSSDTTISTSVMNSASVFFVSPTGNNYKITLGSITAANKDLTLVNISNIYNAVINDQDTLFAKRRIDYYWTSSVYRSAAPNLSNYAGKELYDVTFYGLKGNGSFDNSDTLQSLVDDIPDGSTLFFPQGEYLFSTTVELSKRVNLIGYGSAVLKTASNFPILQFGADEIKIFNLRFNGNTSGGNQQAISSNGYVKFNIENCWFKQFGNKAIEILHTQIGDLGGSITSCEFYNNYSHGIYLGELAEFIRVSNCNFRNNITAIEIIGGNNNITNCNINYNDNGIIVDFGSNNGHGIVANCNINHNSNSLKYFNTTLGYTFTGNHIYQGTIYVFNSVGLDISNSILAPTQWIFEGCSNINVFGNTMSYDYGNTVNNNYNSSVGFANWYNNRNVDGTYSSQFNNASFRANNVDPTKMDLFTTGNVIATGTVTGSNLSGTNTGDVANTVTGTNTAGQIIVGSGGSAVTSSSAFTVSGGAAELSTSLKIGGVPALVGYGTNNRVALWKGTGTQTSDADLTYDSTNNVLGLNGICKIPSTGTGIRLYNTVDEVTNSEYVQLYKTSNVFRLETLRTGTGTPRTLQIIGGATRAWTVGASGLSGIYNGNLATSGGNVSTVGINGSLSASSGINNGYAMVHEINQSGTAGYRGIWIAPKETAVGSGVKNLIDAGTTTGLDGSGTYTSMFSVDNTGGISFSGSFAPPYVAKNATYTIAATDYTIDCTANSFTVTLPTAVGITKREYVISNTGAGTITLATTSSQTINGSLTQSIAAGGGYRVQSNGANWTCVGKW